MVIPRTVTSKIHLLSDFCCARQLLLIEVLKYDTLWDDYTYLQICMSFRSKIFEELYFNALSHGRQYSLIHVKRITCIKNLRYQ